MVKYKRISNQNGVYFYEYYPEGDFSKRCGVIKVDTNKKEIEIGTVAERDFLCKATIEGKQTAWYYFGAKVVSKLQKETTKGAPSEQGMVAWY